MSRIDPNRSNTSNKNEVCDYCTGKPPKKKKAPVKKKKGRKEKITLGGGSGFLAAAGLSDQSCLFSPRVSGDCLKPKASLWDLSSSYIFLNYSESLDRLIQVQVTQAKEVYKEFIFKFEIEMSSAYLIAEFDKLIIMILFSEGKNNRMTHLIAQW